MSNSPSSFYQNPPTSYTADNGSVVTENAPAVNTPAPSSFFDTAGNVYQITQSFLAIYLGAFSADPTLDNFGHALVQGQLYFNTAIFALKVYNGSSWTPTMVSFNGRGGVVVPQTGDYAFNQISGSVAPSQLPTPTAGTIGAIKSAGPTSHQWVASINTDGSVTLTQPAFTDISGTASTGQIPALGGNPAHSVGLTAVNGTATTYLRSDGAPALDVTISPTWTGTHVWTTAPAVQVTGSTANFYINDVTGTNNAEVQFQAAGSSKWEMGKDGSNNFFIFDDVGGANALTATANGGGVAVKGTNTNNSAAAGFIGEYISSSVASGSAVSLVSVTDKNLTSISLTAGDWDLSATFTFTGGATTTVSVLMGSISITSNTRDFTNGQIVQLPMFGSTVFNGIQPTLVVGPVRISLSATTTFYAVAYAGFATSTASVYGLLRARRVR